MEEEEAERWNAEATGPSRFMLSSPRAIRYSATHRPSVLIHTFDKLQGTDYLLGRYRCIVVVQMKASVTCSVQLGLPRR